MVNSFWLKEAQPERYSIQIYIPFNEVISNCWPTRFEHTISKTNIYILIVKYMFSSKHYVLTSPLFIFKFFFYTITFIFCCRNMCQLNIYITSSNRTTSVLYKALIFFLMSNICVWLRRFTGENLSSVVIKCHAGVNTSIYPQFYILN